MFDAVPIFPAFSPKSESSSLQRSSGMSGTIGEKHGVSETRSVSFASRKYLISGDVVDIVFPAEFLQEHLGQGRRRC